MWRVMRLPQLLLLLFMVCSDQATAVSWYPGKLIHMEKLSPSNSSTKVVMEPSDDLSDGQNITHLAIVYSNTHHESVLTGGMATFDVYGFPNLKDRGQVSSADIWVVNQQRDDFTDFNGVQAGWTVNPSEYGDSKTHFFTAWTVVGGNSTGCYNLACDGFVPVNNAPITPGDTLEPTNGQRSITIKIFKNKDGGDWWLHFGYDNQNLSPVGYWPKSIFTNLADHANGVVWGGFTNSYIGDASPPMGNGQWAGINSASIRHVRYVDTNGQGYEPAPRPTDLKSLETHQNCYRISQFLDDAFYYGGPGGCTM